MEEYKKYYECAFEIYNNNNTGSLSSITPYSPPTQYPFYKHYFDEFNVVKKAEMTSSSFSKAKKTPGVNSNK